MKLLPPFFATLALSVASTFADVQLPAIISDNMVLEKTEKVPLWGKADPGEEVSVTLEGQTVKTTADASGRWSLDLDLSKSGPGPFELTVQGKNRLTVSNVVVGEVWLASGQSNMEWTLSRTTDHEKETASSANPLLRQFTVTKNTSKDPLDEVKGTWIIASPEKSGQFSAVGYYFGKTLQNELKVPVGIIHTSWGGTPSEAWTSIPAMQSNPDLKAAQERISKTIETFPGLKEAYITDFAAWLKANNREDKPTPNPALFAGPSVDTSDWVPVTIPGKLDATGLPKSGVVWLRNEIEIPTGKKAHLNLGNFYGFDTVFWNGQEIAKTTHETYPGVGWNRRGGVYNVPENLVKEGKNVLAIRFFEPVEPANIAQDITVNNAPLTTPWLAKAELEFPALDAAQLAAAPKPPAQPTNPHHAPGYLFNAMINPLVPYAISGFIWYQGESNVGRAFQYRTAFPLMIQDWRTQWGQDDLPFYFCQLANFLDKRDEPGDSGWAELREAQNLTLELPKTGQAILIDIGESKDIHPRNKKDVGIRLAKIALAKDYGKSGEYSGPVFEEAKVDGDKIRVTFKHTDGGLVAKALPETYDVVTLDNKTAPLKRNSPDSEVEGFAICGEDRQWVWADAKIDGNSVVVSSPKVSKPVAVRYGWADNPTLNLYNGAGLPAGPFRSDDFPLQSKDKKL